MAEMHAVATGPSTGVQEERLPSFISIENSPQLSKKLINTN